MVFWSIVAGALAVVLALSYWYDARTAARRERLGQGPSRAVELDLRSSDPDAYRGTTPNGAGG